MKANKSYPLNLADRLRATLPKPFLDLLTEVGQKAVAMEVKLYIVGGFGRDLYLNIPSLDSDLVVEGDAIALAQAMQAQYGGQVKSHQRFGTASWLLSQEQAKRIQVTDRLDFAMARTEVYRHPTALPDVEPASMTQDLRRRDFTINTLALSLNPEDFGAVLDVYAARQDIENKCIRILHHLSFVEDPTRIFRAIRFEQRFDFHLEAQTLEHLQNALDLIPRLTHRRIFNELLYGFKEKYPEKVMGRLSDLGVLAAIQPDLAAGSWYTKRCQHLRTGLAETPWAKVKPEPDHYFGLLSFPLCSASCQSLSKRLQLPAAQERLLTQIQAVKVLTPILSHPQKPSQLYEHLHLLSDDALLVCWLSMAQPLVRQSLSLFSHRLRQVQVFTTGKDLVQQFGLTPSPLIGQILTRLRQAHLDGEISTLAEEHRLIQEAMQ